MARPTDDPYRTLGILRGAEPDEVRAAHRRLAKRFHPDGSMGDEQRFLAVQEAYQLLSDPLRRREWDRQHVAGPVPARPPTRPGPPRPRRARPAAARPARPTRPSRPQPAPGVRTRTWTAEHVPWWLDFNPRERRDDGPAPAESPPRPPDREHRGRPADLFEADLAGPRVEMDVFNRSSGAAWSMAARRHFRRAEQDRTRPTARETATRQTETRTTKDADQPPPKPEERSTP